MHNNTKITLTLGQLKHLVKESSRVDEFDVVDPTNPANWEEWERRLRDKASSGFFADDHDFLDRPLSPGDWVLFMTGGQYKHLAVGKVLAVQKQITILCVRQNGDLERVTRPCEHVFRLDNPQNLV